MLEPASTERQPLPPSCLPNAWRTPPASLAAAPASAAWALAANAAPAACALAAAPATSSSIAACARRTSSHSASSCARGTAAAQARGRAPSPAARARRRTAYRPQAPGAQRVAASAASMFGEPRLDMREARAPTLTHQTPCDAAPAAKPDNTARARAHRLQRGQARAQLGLLRGHRRGGGRRRVLARLRRALQRARRQRGAHALAHVVERRAQRRDAARLAARLLRGCGGDAALRRRAHRAAQAAVTSLEFQGPWYCAQLGSTAPTRARSMTSCRGFEAGKWCSMTHCP
jgi:hypothetical protein